MDLPTFRTLLTPAGRRALADATARNPTESAFLAAFETLRKTHPEPLAKAALETVLLRAKARAKFPQADRLFFTREALEQSSGWVAARHRAARLAGFPTVADLGCGAGGDALALAAAGMTVEAVERDPLLAAMAEANAAELGLRIAVRIADVLADPLPPVDAAFADPARRSAGRRFLALSDYQPPPAAIRDRFPSGFPLAFKLAPGLDRNDLIGWDAEAEFVSVTGELKECVLWCGPLKQTPRRATVLTETTAHALAGDAADAEPGSPSEPLAYLFDPDPAVVRAELEHALAAELDLFPLDAGVAFFTGEAASPSPFGRWYRVEHAAAFHAGKLRDYLRASGVGRVTVVKRASDLNADEVVGKLKLTGGEHRHLFLTRHGGRPWAVVATM